MPQRYPEMKTHVHADIKHRIVTIVVEHDPGQSFSRAVIPKARKEYRRWLSTKIMFGKPTEHSHSLGWFDTPDGRTLSVTRFGY